MFSTVACGGRTAHKGARHGLNLTGKLKRIAEQERLFLEKMQGKTQNKHEVFREPCAKKVKKSPLGELNSSKEEETDETSPERDYVLKASKKRKKRDKIQEQLLVKKIEGIGLEEPATEFEHPTEHEEDEEAPYNGTPVRKKKKSKKVLGQLGSIQESVNVPAAEDQVKSKKKKNKRKFNDDDESMLESKEHRLRDKSSKRIKMKLDNSYEASESDEDTADKINAEQESLHFAKKLKKSTKKREKLRLKNAYEALNATNL